MKNIFFLFFILAFGNLTAQLPLPFNFEGVLGLRLNILAHQARPDDGNALITSPLVGLKISHQKSPFALTFMHDRSYFFWHYPQNGPSDVQEINEGNMLRFQYQGKRFHYGIGHYWYRQHGYLDHVFPLPPFIIRYVAFMIAVPVGRAEIEFQSLMRYTIFDVGDRYLQEINFKYHFGSGKYIEKKYPTRFLSLHFALGGRWFLPDQPYLPGERKDGVSTAAVIGIEILADKFRTGVFWQKDGWIALNAGSPRRLIKGLIINNVFGLKYHYPLKGNTSINLALGGAWIVDLSAREEIRKRIVKGELSRKLWNNNIHGLSIAPSYNFNRKLEVELRQIIATKGEKGWALERLSLGIFYKIKA